MPGLGARDVGAGRRCTAPGIRGPRLDNRGVAALFRGNGMRIALARVLVTVGELRRGNGRKNETRAEASRPLRPQPGTQTRPETFVRDTRGGQLVAPQLRVAGLCLRQLQKKILAQRISLRGRKRRIEFGAIDLVAEIFSIALDVGLHTSA